LVDVAWACLDLNASVLSTMPVYRTRNGVIVEPDTWMVNPDSTTYASWHEFAKQLFWDYQLGEVFVMPMAFYSDGWPMSFRVIPPWLVNVEMRGDMRIYKLGGPGGRDVTGEILHIRYKSTTADARGVGALESAGGRMLTAGILAKYVREVVSTGGIQIQTLETDQELETEDAQDLLNHWVTTRAQNLGYPPVLDNNVKLVDHPSVSPKDLAMLEITQFTEARIAVLLGVPPFLAALPSGNEMTYSNVSQVFDFHDRAGLRPKASTVMSAISNWALPRGQAAELNRDEYSRPSFNERADAWVKLKGAGLITEEQFRAAERLTGVAPAVSLTGGDLS
jgi:phage portal protein BeeE